MKRLLALCLALGLFFALAFPAFGVKGPKGDAKKAYDSAFALYASSVSANIQNKFICTAEAIAKVNGGYELLSAGHCTPANEELPSDMTFSVSESVGGALVPVTLVKAVMVEPVDFSIFYLQTDKGYPVLSLGDDQDAQIGDKVLVANCTEGAVKQVAEGTVVSSAISSDPEVAGMFLIQVMAGPGASGSAVWDERTHKVIGVLVMGLAGELVIIEPIDNVTSQIAGLLFPPSRNSADIKGATANDLPFYDARHRGSVSGAPRGEHARSGDSRDTGHRNRPQEPRDEHRGRAHEGRARSHQGPERHGRIHRREVRVVHDHLCIRWQGEWFFAESYPQWLFSDDVYFVEIAPGVWEVIDFENPTLVLQVVIED